MQLSKILIAIGIISTGSQACIKQVDVVTRNEKPILVVEGSISTDSLPYTVRLTYSGPITSSEAIPDQYLVKDAVVTITDNLANSTQLVYTDQGIYETTDPQYIGKVGSSYFVTVVLKDGKKYISTQEKIEPPVPVSNVNVAFVSKFDFNFPTYLKVSVDTKDPVQEENYYRWTFYTWVGRQSTGESCGFGCTMYSYCYQKFVEKEVHILSDVSINGNDIKDQAVGRCYIYTYLNPYIDIGQISLTREAYQFWKSYQDQQTRTGGILDPLPATIRGNVYNASNTTDFTLGYFSASSITHKRVILVPYSLTPYLMQLSAEQFIPPNSGACFNYFPNSLVYAPPPARQNPPPPGWENAEEIKVYW